MISLSLLIGLVFSPLAGVCAFLITYHEYQRHYPGDSKKPLRLALETAVVALAVFMILSLMIGLLLKKNA